MHLRRSDANTYVDIFEDINYYSFCQHMKKILFSTKPDATWCAKYFCKHIQQQCRKRFVCINKPSISQNTHAVIVVGRAWRRLWFVFRSFLTSDCIIHHRMSNSKGNSNGTIASAALASSSILSNYSVPIYLSMYVCLSAITPSADTCWPDCVCTYYPMHCTGVTNIHSFICSQNTFKTRTLRYKRTGRTRHILCTNRGPQ